MTNWVSNSGTDDECVGECGGQTDKGRVRMIAGLMSVRIVALGSLQVFTISQFRRAVEVDGFWWNRWS
jgi:hypothetical protein